MPQSQRLRQPPEIRVRILRQTRGQTTPIPCVEYGKPSKKILYTGSLCPKPLPPSGGKRRLQPNQTKKKHEKTDDHLVRQHRLGREQLRRSRDGVERQG